EALIARDSVLSARAARRRRIEIGADAPDATLSADGGAVLIAGSSGFGKSTLATALLEKLAAQGFQLCIVDPEGDYDELEPAIIVGDAKHEPVALEAMNILERDGLVLGVADD